MIQCIMKLNNNRSKTNLTNVTIKYSNIYNKPKHEDYATERAGNSSFKQRFSTHCFIISGQTRMPNRTCISKNRENYTGTNTNDVTNRYTSSN